MVERQVSFRSEDRLDLCQQKNAAVSWPIPLDSLLDVLVGLADDAAQRTTRKELAAAILFAAPRNGDELAALLTRYRSARVVDVAPGASAGESAIPFRIRRSGPRSRSPRADR